MDFMSEYIVSDLSDDILYYCLTFFFFSNFATDWRGRATVVAGTAVQQYVDNIFYNPDNDYEMITVNRSM